MTVVNARTKNITVGHAIARQCAIQIIARMASANQPPVAHSARIVMTSKLATVALGVVNGMHTNKIADNALEMPIVKAVSIAQNTTNGTSNAKSRLRLEWCAKTASLILSVKMGESALTVSVRNPAR